MAILTDENYVDKAENVITRLKKNKAGRYLLTTSKIRNLLSLTSTLFDESKIKRFDQLTDRIAYLRVQYVYQAGREEAVKDLVEKGQILEKPKDLIKDPYVLEFLGLPEKANYSENDLESGLIDKLEHFLLELGTGFTFVARQNRITFDEKHFKIDLVFYNRILKCFVLIDLKIGELKHQDIGQMQMYVNYYDREVRLEEENKTIGIILCQDKSEALVKYTLPEDNEQIFASKYLTIIPSKEDFIKILQGN